MLNTLIVILLMFSLIARITKSPVTHAALKWFVMSEQDAEHTPLANWKSIPQSVAIDKDTVITEMRIQKNVIKDHNGLGNACVDNFFGRYKF